MSEPIAVAAQLVRGEWADETAEGESGALEKLTDLMREAGVMIRDQYDELARLRKNTKAIVTAVNNFETIAERCKRAEQWNDYDATIAELTRQRDELLAALRNIADKDDYAADDPHGCLNCIIGIAKASVKGGADGKA